MFIFFLHNAETEAAQASKCLHSNVLQCVIAGSSQIMNEGLLLSLNIKQNVNLTALLELLIK